MDRFDLLIVGTGHGGAHLAAKLRQRKFEGTVGLIGDEPELPYERPPLSKEFLSGERTFERLLLRPPEFWDKNEIRLLRGRTVTGVDPASHSVRLENGREIGYGSLVWAAGGRARKLRCPGGDLSGVHTVRNRADIDRIVGDLDRTQHVAVIGAGYVGLEAAAVFRSAGKQVSVIEAQQRVLARVTTETLSRFVERKHRERGVDIRLGCGVDSLEGVSGRVTGVRLSSGEILPADMVIVGIGIEPAVEPVISAGAAENNGVLVDGYCRTSLPDVYAIGDCAAYANAYANHVVMRVESVQNATDMASALAKTLTGTPTHYDAVPWFWSNQYDLRLQSVGLAVGHDRVLIRGDDSHPGFSLIYLRQDMIVALDCVNATSDFVKGKALVSRKAILKDSAIADPAVPMADCVT